MFSCLGHCCLHACVHAHLCMCVLLSCWGCWGPEQGRIAMGLLREMLAYSAWRIPFLNSSFSVGSRLSRRL